MKVKLNSSKISVKKIIIITISIVLAIVLLLFSFVVIDSIPSDFKPDRFGPFSNETYPLEVEKAVKANTKFKLSKSTTISKPENHLIDKNVTCVYELSYNRYPIITTELEASRLTTAYAMSILDMSYEKASIFTMNDKTVVPYLFMYPVERNINLGITVESDGKLSQSILYTKNKCADISIVSSDGLISLLYYAEENKTDLVYKNFANDALVFFTSVDNPVESIYKDDLKAIYNGKIRNWKKLGGQNIKINKYERYIHSSAQEAFEIYVLDMYQQQKEWVEILDVHMHESDRQEYINSTNSIGYCLKSQFDVSYAKDHNIKILKINDIFPTDETISNGAYPLSVPYYYVYKLKDKSNTAGQFTDWMLSNEGLKCLYAAGLIPTKNIEEKFFNYSES